MRSGCRWYQQQCEYDNDQSVHGECPCVMCDSEPNVTVRHAPGIPWLRLPRRYRLGRFSSGRGIEAESHFVRPAFAVAAFSRGLSRAQRVRFPALFAEFCDFDLSCVTHWHGWAKRVVPIRARSGLAAIKQKWSPFEIQSTSPGMFMQRRRPTGYPPTRRAAATGIAIKTFGDVPMPAWSADRARHQSGRTGRAPASRSSWPAGSIECGASAPSRSVPAGLSEANARLRRFIAVAADALFPTSGSPAPIACSKTLPLGDAPGRSFQRLLGSAGPFAARGSGGLRNYSHSTTHTAFSHVS